MFSMNRRALMRKVWDGEHYTLSLVGRYAISGIVGVFANLIFFTLLVGVYEVWYVFGAFLGFLAAYIVTFTMHKYWTFRESSKERLVTQGWLYLCSALVVLLINTGVLHVLISKFSIFAPLAQFVSLGIATVASFLFTSKITFHADSARTSAFFQYLKKISKTHTFWLIFIFLICTTTLAIRLHFFPITFSSDAVSYVATADLIAGNEEGAFYGERLLKPLAPAAMVVLSALGMSMTEVLLYQAGLSYLILGGAVYWFGFVLFGSRGLAALVSLFVVTSYPIFRYGIDMYTETGVWAIYFALLASTILWHKTVETKWLWISALLVLLGLMWKEYVVLAGLILSFTITFHPDLSVREKILSLVQVGALSLIPWFAWQYVVFLEYGYTYLDWLRIGTASEAYSSEYSIVSVVKSTFGLLFSGWIFVVLGLIQYRSWPLIVQRFFWYMLLPSFGFLLWGYVSSRLFFSLVPLAVVVAVMGFVAIQGRQYRVVAISFFIIVNSILTVLAFNPNIRSLLTTLAYGN